MATDTKKRNAFSEWLDGIDAFGDGDTEAWNKPVLYPLFAGVACRKCHCPLLIDLGLENKSSKPKSVKQRRHWYSCPLCEANTIRPDVTGELRQVGEIDRDSWQFRKLDAPT